MTLLTGRCTDHPKATSQSGDQDQRPEPLSPEKAVLHFCP